MTRLAPVSGEGRRPDSSSEIWVGFIAIPENGKGNALSEVNGVIWKML
ncbi:MAG: hypothetical protein JWM42_2822 [Burkholderia sp.]|nr:hypothetical protein [Burkholderia sp.]